MPDGAIVALDIGILLGLTGLDVKDVVVCQRVVAQQCGFIAWQIEERGTLALG